MIKTSLYKDAFKYFEVWGFSVIPVGKDKRPLLSSWKEFQTRKATEAELKSWWTKWPEANIGIVTGKISGITVVDVDLHKGANRNSFPQTYTVETGNKGLQLYYKYHPGLSVSANGYPDLPHVDIRSDGGFVVAPPSITDYMENGIKKGGPYEVIMPGDFSSFPAHLFKETKKKNKLADLVSVSKGSRNSSMASIIGTLILPMQENRFLTEGWDAVAAINKTYSPPLSSIELKTTFDSIVEKERQRRSQVGKPTPSPIQISPDERIEILLRKNSNGVPYKDMTNAVMVFSQHPQTAGKIKYNEFKQEIEFNGKPVDDNDLLNFVYLMQNDAGLPNISKETVQSALQRYAFQNRFDEAVDWLKTIEWDGVPRLATWLVQAINCPDDEYHRGIGAQWFRGLVSRLMYPGCVFDYVLVIIGPQGVGKTSLFRIVGGDWYKSFTGTVENKDFYLQLRGAAIIDLDEGVALYRSESIKMKSIITQVQDEYRAPYDRMTKKYPRRFVFSMSTNDSEPFRDVTGNRRYWPVEIKDAVNFKWLEENRDQLYAEAYHVIKNKTHLPEVPFKVAEEYQENYLPGDEWEEAIERYIRKSYDYCTGSPEYEVGIYEIYEKVLNGPTLEKLERKHEIRIGTILKKMGFVKRRLRSSGQRVYRYVLNDKRINELKQNPLVPLDDIIIDNF